VSEDSGATPAPYVLDVSVLTAITRGDYGIMTFILGLDASGQPQVIPALAIAGASLDLRSDDTEAILHGLGRLESVMIAPLRDAEQAVRLAAVIARTALDPWDAHVAAVADAAVCPILTLDAGKWREHAADLDEPLHFIEISDPDEAPGGPGPGVLGARSARARAILLPGRPAFPERRRHRPGASAQAAGQAGPGGGHTAPACPVPPLRAGYAASQPGRRLVCGWSRQPWRRARRQRFRLSLIGMPGWMMCYQR
jgi:predicted nucleic acid-binding protein